MPFKIRHFTHITVTLRRIIASLKVEMYMRVKKNTFYQKHFPDMSVVIIQMNFTCSERVYLLVASIANREFSFVVLFRYFFFIYFILF